MDYKFKGSIERAITLLDTTADYHNYLLLKFTLEPFSCHHLHHWPNTWKQINEYIYPCNPIEDEGNALIKKDESKFVLESHESGLEIIAYLAGATALANLLKSIIDLAITIVKGFSAESRKQSSCIKISRRQVIKGKLKENIIEIDIPLSEEAEKNLDGKIKNLLTKNP